MNISTNSGSYFYACILQMRVWRINQSCHHLRDALLVFSTSRLCAHLALAVVKFSDQLTKYLAACPRTICCVSLIHRSSQSQRNRQKSLFGRVQLCALHAGMGWIFLTGVLRAHSSLPGSTSSNDAKFLLCLPN